VAANIAVRIVYSLVTRGIRRRSQAWTAAG